MTDASYTDTAESGTRFTNSMTFFLMMTSSTERQPAPERSGRLLRAGSERGPRRGGHAQRAGPRRRDVPPAGPV